VSDRRRQGGFITSPVLIGAVTVLVAIVAVFLAYNANNGLPFVPRYSLHVQVRDASELTSGAEVHMVGGALVGHVDSIDPARTSGGAPIAVLNLALNKSIQPLPANTTFDIRLKAVIGLKYLQITPGNSRRVLANGATVPLSHSSEEVDLDQLLSMYTPPTRAGIVAATAGYAYGLAGRGSDLNSAIHAFVPLVTDLGPVARNLASKKTDFAGFFHGLEAFSHAVAPVAQTQADLYVNLDTTFRSLATVAYPYLQDWISQTPPTFQTVIAQAPTIRPFVTDTTALFAELRPGFATLPQSAPVLAEAFAAGTRNLPGTYTGPHSLNAELTSLALYLENYTNNPPVLPGLQRLTLLASSLKSPLQFLTPVQATCNYVTLFLRNTASLLSDPIATGTRLRFNIVAIDDVLGAESVPSQKPYTTPDTNPADSHGPLHVDPYPNTASPGQVRECSAGNEPFSAAHAVIGNPSGNVGIKTQQTTVANPSGSSK
jgi:ABC-type transporter Mla subunit MlaD